MALLMGLLARLATLILVLAVLGLRLLVDVVVTGEGTVGVKAVVGDGWRCLDANWGLGKTLVWFWFGLVGMG